MSNSERALAIANLGTRKLRQTIYELTGEVSPMAIVCCRTGVFRSYFTLLKLERSQLIIPDPQHVIRSPRNLNRKGISYRRMDVNFDTCKLLIACLDLEDGLDMTYFANFSSRLDKPAIRLIGKSDEFEGWTKLN